MTYEFMCKGCGYSHVFSTKIHQFNGDMEKPTLHPSMLCNFSPDRICHSWIKEGKIQYLNDCWHELKGQTIELEDIS